MRTAIEGKIGEVMRSVIKHRSDRDRVRRIIEL